MYSKEVIIVNVIMVIDINISENSRMIMLTALKETGTYKNDECIWYFLLF